MIRIPFYSRFIAGTKLKDALYVAKTLKKKKVGTIYDFSVESSKHLYRNIDEIYNQIEKIDSGFIALKFLIGIDNHLFFSMAFSNFTYSIFFAALWKGPCFGLVIGLISCFEGQKVKVSAEEVAKASTKGVVYSIVCVILLDTFFNVLFTGIS